MDPWTAETLGRMVKYVKCDAKIARYLGIDEARVRSARGYVPRGRIKAAAAFDQRDYVTSDAKQRDAAQKASERLLRALQGVSR